MTAFILIISNQFLVQDLRNSIKKKKKNQFINFDFECDNKESSAVATRAPKLQGIRKKTEHVRYSKIDYRLIISNHLLLQSCLLITLLAACMTLSLKLLSFLSATFSNVFLKMASLLGDPEKKQEHMFFRK